MVDVTVLQALWFGLIAVLWIGYLVLEGFDYGVAMLIPFLGRNDKERRVMVNTVGPVWEGNQVWLILGGGAMGAFALHTAHKDDVGGWVSLDPLRSIGGSTAFHNPRGPWEGGVALADSEAEPAQKPPAVLRLELSPAETCGDSHDLLDRPADAIDVDPVLVDRVGPVVGDASPDIVIGQLELAAGQREEDRRHRVAPRYFHRAWASMACTTGGNRLRTPRTSTCSTRLRQN